MAPASDKDDFFRIEMFEDKLTHQRAVSKATNHEIEIFRLQQSK
jgi:hypothetical protein